MPFSDLALSQRLERAEGYAAAQYAEARRRVFPDSNATSMEHAGAYVIFDGPDSPVTQTFGLGLFEELTPATLETIERFFVERGSPVQHEISPHIGITGLRLLCARGYRPSEVSNVMHRPVEQPKAGAGGAARARVARPDETRLWTDLSARGWAQEHPEFLEFLLESGTITAARQNSVCFIAELEGVPGAIAALSIHGGVALFAGSATVPEFRRCGLQAALLEERMRYACEHGCDLAMMVAEVGSESQRNAERQGFSIAYTRLKWRLDNSVKRTTAT